MLGHRQSIVGMFLHPQRQGLDTGQQQKSIERRQSRTEIAQAQNAAGNGETEIAKGFPQNHAAIFRTRLRQHRITARFDEIERAAIDNQTADGIAMATQKFGCRMDDNIGPVLEGADQIGRGHRIVDNQRHTGFMGNIGNGTDINHHTARIGNGFDKDRLCLGRNGPLETRGIIRIRPDHIPVKVFIGVIELVNRPAIEFFGGDEFIPRLQQRMEHQKFCGMARGHRQSGRAAFKRCHALFQHRASGIADPGVDIAESLQAKQRGGMIHIVKHKARCLVNRRGPRACRRIGCSTGMNGQSGKTGVMVRHGSSPFAKT